MDYYEQHWNWNNKLHIAKIILWNSNGSPVYLVLLKSDRSHFGHQSRVSWTNSALLQQWREAREASAAAAVVVECDVHRHLVVLRSLRIII